LTSKNTTGTGGSAAKGGNSSTGGFAAKGGNSSTGGFAAKGGNSSTGGSSTGGTTSTSSIEFAPYFYTWGWGNSVYPFTALVELKTQSQIESVTLAFVLSNGQCAVTTDIQDHLNDVKAFQAAGGHVKVSFGGANGTYLENACTSAQSLATAINEFVTQTGLTDFDFDVEQAGAMDATVNARRAQALKLVQDTKGIQVSYTLAATPQDKWGTLGGVSAAGLAVLKASFDANIVITRVNLMVMDYGPYYSSGNTMGALAVSALKDAKTQLMTLQPTLTEAAAWHLLGATPMIGQNDVSSEVFTLDDARTLVSFAKQNHLGLVSFWAINRDQPCPYSDLGVCSTVNTADFEFSTIFRGVE
jgi:chitinase